MTTKAVSGKAPLSVSRVLQILKVLSLAEQPIGLAELSRRLATPKTSLIGLLRGLVDMNYIVFSDGTYRLGGSAFELANQVLSARQRLHMGDYVRQGMNALSNRSGETVLYGITTGEDPPVMTYVGVVESRSAIRISVGIGDRSQLYCTAGGRVLLAAMSDEEVRQYLKTAPLNQINPQTQTDPDALFELIRKTREEDFSCVADQMIQGITGMAAPVRDSSNEVVGALIMAGPTSRMMGEETTLRSMVLEAAHGISNSLGHHGRREAHR
ncbi:IclR family transcriptional regulator [Novosphingobium malaysiense]|nr:IclR family transcriptional regulator [Novosphingobium malaysiense]